MRPHDLLDLVVGIVVLALFVAVFTLLTACADAPSVRVRVDYTQPCVPPDVDEFVVAGAQAWRSVGVDYATSSSAPACAARWMDAPELPCTFTVRVTFADLGPYAGLRAGNDLMLAYQAQGFDLASTFAHELGHAVWDSGDHLAPGELGIMEFGERGDIAPTDADLVYVHAHAPGFYP